MKYALLILLIILNFAIGTTIGRAIGLSDNAYIVGIFLALALPLSIRILEARMNKREHERNVARQEWMQKRLAELQIKPGMRFNYSEIAKDMPEHLRNR